MNINKKKLIFFVLPLTILVLSVFLFYLKFQIPRGPKPQMVSVSPTLGEQEVSLLPEITITFDQKVSPSQVSISSIPSVSFQLLSDVPSTTLKYQPQQLLEKRADYQISLKFKFGGEYSWHFTTSESEAGAVPGWAENSQKALEQYFQEYPPEEVKIVNSIVSLMPYFTSAFWIEYSSRSNTFAVHLCKQPYETTKEATETWFNDQGWQKLVKLKPQIDWLYGCEPPKIIPEFLPTPPTKLVPPR